MGAKLALAGLVAAVSLAAGAANATTITVSAFDISSFTGAVAGNFVVQDFENLGLPAGQLSDPLSTNVGTFDALLGQGSGSTCGASGGDCTQLFLSNTTVNGQGNMVPTDGIWSLNANDTFGIFWEVVKGEGGSFFNRVVFALMDAADQGASVTVTTSNGGLAVFNDLLNSNKQLIVIDFDSLIDFATISIASTTTNDSFSIDGASVGVVPVPAAGLLLIGGLGALAAVRRKKRAG